VKAEVAMVWVLTQLAMATPLSVGAWISDPTPVASDVWEVGGSPDGGWLMVSRGDTNPFGGVLYGQRAAPDGSLVDFTPVALMPYTSDATVLWDGSTFVVVATTSNDYTESVAIIEAARVPPTGLLLPTLGPLAWSGLRWPGSFAGACDGAGGCVVAFEEAALIDHSLRLSFDASGPIELPTPIDGGEGETPFEAVRDGDATLMVTSSPAMLVWLPDDLASPPERLALPDGDQFGFQIRGLAMGPDGVALVVWTWGSHDVRILAQRYQRGVGALDPTPIDLGGATFRLTVDVVFTGTSFVVGLDNREDDLHQLVRIGTDGAVLGEPIEVGPPHGGMPGPNPGLLELVAGAPGHMLWHRRICGYNDPETDWCDEYADSYRIVEIDVPDGGLCSDASACISGVCGGGVCGGVGDTGAAGDSGADTGALRSTDGGDDPEKGCSCGSGRAGAGALGVLLAAFAGRRRHDRDHRDRRGSTA
jgi:MYXO-CTERM domain-containing protein